MDSATPEKHERDWTGIALTVAAAWIAFVFVLSAITKVEWLSPSDFDYVTAMNYHGLMVPLLVMSYLLAGRILPVETMRGRAFAVLAMLSVVLVGPASLANSVPGFSLVSVLQISGMVLADLLGVVVLVALIRAASRQRDTEREDAVYWLFFCAVAGVVSTAPYAHLAGWGVDIGIRNFPGVSALLNGTGMKPDDLQEALVTTHSHLIVTALITALVALVARMFGYGTLRGWRRRLGLAAVWLVVLSLASVAVIYAAGTLSGWEPPALLISGPNSENGIPLDDIALSLCELGWVILILTSAGADAERAGNRVLTRAAVLLNVIAGFFGVVALGLYVELNETFFGGGELPAPGALNDQAFIRAHLIYPLLVLPILLGFILATASDAVPARGARKWHRVFLWLSISGMVLGLAGECVWVAYLDQSVLQLAMALSGAAMIAGAAGLRGGRF